MARTAVVTGKKNIKMNKLCNEKNVRVPRRYVGNYEKNEDRSKNLKIVH